MLRLRMIAGYCVLLSVLAGCGGRAMYDSDPVGVEPSPRSGQGVGGNAPSTAGAPSARAGNSGSSIGGDTGGTEITDAPCANYCTAQAQHVCAFETDVHCTQSCREELGRQTLACQKTAAAMIDCLVAAYQSSSDCSTAEQSARVRCASWVSSYQDCLVEQPDPPELPMPTDPPPRPPTPPVPAGCSGSGSGSASYCTLSMKCAGRLYDDILCEQNGDGSSSCSCGGTFVVVNESVVTACATGISNCAR